MPTTRPAEQHAQTNAEASNCVQYLDRYLWPHYSEAASSQHVMSIAAMVVERARENVPAWACFAGTSQLLGFDSQIGRLLSTRAWTS